ncbi:gamma-glutamylcyclotransferase [Candidatus Macondimonas diazotrophica]|nr:gamma-glutamylcyclotransferase [Candidatus Macondimonas diazotrophica]HBG29404.1 gamma-glutamylcyclotransferase [Gammaproteobacteria bacterium]
MRRPALFVYGTLRRGEPAQHLLAGADYLGAVVISRRFDLRALARYPMAWSPGRHAVAGECYRVSPLTLRRVDRFEQIPWAYRRRLIRTLLGWAWIYLGHDGADLPRRGRRLPHGLWRSVPRTHEGRRVCRTGLAAVRRYRD